MLVQDIVHDVVKESDMGLVNRKDGGVTLFFFLPGYYVWLGWS